MLTKKTLTALTGLGIISVAGCGGITIPTDSGITDQAELDLYLANAADLAALLGIDLSGADVTTEIAELTALAQNVADSLNALEIYTDGDADTDDDAITAADIFANPELVSILSTAEYANTDGDTILTQLATELADFDVTGTTVADATAVDTAAETTYDEDGAVTTTEADVALTVTTTNTVLTTADIDTSIAYSFEDGSIAIVESTDADGVTTFSLQATATITVGMQTDTVIVTLPADLDVTADDFDLAGLTLTVAGSLAITTDATTVTAVAAGDDFVITAAYATPATA